MPRRQYLFIMHVMMYVLFEFFVVGCWISDPILILFHTILTFDDPVKEAFENIVGKGENAGNQHFLLFPQCFLPF